MEGSSLNKDDIAFLEDAINFYRIIPHLAFEFAGLVFESHV